MATSTPSTSATPLITAVASATPSSTRVFIFQLPATMGMRREPSFIRRRGRRLADDVAFASLTAGSCSGYPPSPLLLSRTDRLALAERGHPGQHPTLEELDG